MADSQERIGQQIGDYRLLRQLGKGSFGTVYLAEHLYDHTPAAIKLLQFPLTSRKHLHEFLNEARTMRLQHPHIVPLLDFGLSHDDLPYLVMEYAAGGTLHEHFPRGSKVPLETIDAYILDLASALQYTHDRRIIHRDIKPENILLRRDGTILLSDFGIAKIIEQATLSSLHHGAGTAAYTAPEQSQGHPGPSSDQYALAVVVYEWLSGQLPFRGQPLEVLYQHHTKAPPSLRAICPEISLQMEQVIFTALAKKPEERFPTITHFAQAFHKVLLQEQIAKQTTTPYPETLSEPTVPIQPLAIAPQRQNVKPIPPPLETSGRQKEMQVEAKPPVQFAPTLPPRPFTTPQEPLKILRSANAPRIHTSGKEVTDRSGPVLVQARVPNMRLLLIVVLPIAILFVALGSSGLIYLAVGNKHSTPRDSTLGTVHVAASVTPTSTLQPMVPLGFPQFTPIPTTLESATGGIGYSVAMQVVDKSSGKPVHASDITCKAWLVQQIPAGQFLSLDENTLKNVNNLTSPITGTINNKPAPEVAGLTFDLATPQTGFCNTNGQRTWKYTLVSTVPLGNYDLVILADWRGAHWNWSYTNITIQ
jgi:serine/threonine protein kinase